MALPTGAAVGLSPAAGGGWAVMDPGVKRGFSGKMVQTGNGVLAQQTAGQPQNLPCTYNVAVCPYVISPPWPGQGGVAPPA